MDKKNLLKKWLFTVIISYIVMFFILFSAGEFGYETGEPIIFYVVVWTISYTIFYFARNHRVLLDKR